MIDTIFFDGDQTLWDFNAIMRRALSASLEELRRRHPGSATATLDVDSLIMDRDTIASRMPATSLKQVRLEAFRHTLMRVGIREDGLAEDLTTSYRERRHNDMQLYPDTVPALTALSESYTVGLLTNGNSEPDRHGLSRLFAVQVFADDHGSWKPDRRLFDVAAAKVGTRPERIAMVGDSAVHDVRGAQGAGWAGIWLNRDGATADDGITPDAEIASLHELSGVLEARA